MKSGFGLPFASYRQSLNSCLSRPSLLMVLRKRAGMIWSVSMLSIDSGTSRLSNVVNFFMRETPYVGNSSGYGSCGGGERAGEERTSALALTAFEVTIADRYRILARGQLVAVHRNAHGASSFAPV